MEKILRKRIERVTSPQKTFLRELSQNRYLSILTTPCDELGQWMGLENFSGKLQAKSIYRLAEDGFVSFEPIKDVNLRWDVCRITELGRRMLDELDRTYS